MRIAKEARAYTELRRTLRAVPLLTEVLTRYDATHVRELALYLWPGGVEGAGGPADRGPLRLLVEPASQSEGRSS
ncbi:hypothetical protein ABZ260_31555 [Streptosporangium sp. NPDC006013]|uniref:hypothetical protein n=1 Tax=Streptosporangium sp. NPDC006013 TaxID=3155596 RepID=UPI0033BC9CAF